MAVTRFDARALAAAGLTRDQIRMLESLFKDVDALALIQVVLAAANPLFPAGRVLTDTATIDIDTATAGQIKAAVIDGSITTTKLGGDITAFAKTLLDDADAATARATLGISAGSAAWTEYEIDFGTTGVYDATFTVVDAAVTALTEVAVVQSGATATGRADGDALWDSIAYAAVPAAGSFTLYALATPGPVVGKRKILYQVGT